MEPWNLGTHFQESPLYACMKEFMGTPFHRSNVPNKRAILQVPSKDRG